MLHNTDDPRERVRASPELRKFCTSFFAVRQVYAALLADLTFLREEDLIPAEVMVALGGIDLPDPLPASSWEKAFAALKTDAGAPLPQFVNLGLDWYNFFTEQQMANALADVASDDNTEKN